MLKIKNKFKKQLYITQKYQNTCCNLETTKEVSKLINKLYTSIIIEINRYIDENILPLSNYCFD